MMVEKSIIHQTFVPLVCIGLIAYFAYHAISGRHGLEARAKLQLRERVLERQLSDLEAVRDRLERDVALLDPESLDPDMLDEQARRILGYAGREEIIITFPEPLD